LLIEREQAFENLFVSKIDRKTVSGGDSRVLDVPAAGVLQTIATAMGFIGVPISGKSAHLIYQRLAAICGYSITAAAPASQMS